MVDFFARVCFTTLERGIVERGVLVERVARGARAEEGADVVVAGAENVVLVEGATCGPTLSVRGRSDLRIRQEPWTHMYNVSIVLPNQGWVQRISRPELAASGSFASAVIMLKGCMGPWRAVIRSTSRGFALGHWKSGRLWTC